MRFLFFLVCLVLVLDPMASMATETVTVAGTGDSQELLRRLAAAYQQKMPGVRVEVPDSIGSSGGVKATARGDCDLGRVARPLKEKEKAYGLHYRVFAYSPVVFVVHRSVTGIDNLTTEQILAIYSGKIQNWKELGGPDARILVANREKGDSSRSVLEKKIPGFRDLTFVGETVYSTPEAVEILSSHENTIGYLPLAMAIHSNLKVLKFNGIAPEAGAVLSGQYPLASPFGIIWKDGVKQSALGFMSYLFTPEARRLMQHFGVIATID
ncbi:phosphate ABC transporter substrate-binding protein (PhoT family) [Geothermobacter ehrlichii]|uniref:Phosphate ABC transporter substrate-binding protein (PhoT family) n=1 Tax=Geothermobacter ehrlichii TaxID=213224 RepID=A0A5D3WIZ9_9BACT|nr:substrate-binding domain-containing protein [Geothermobacter ehrlichii]TYO98903.1 phosphate ABC transporter substrate-binding protein (PhoT family) [Geothermobacter ehrlichii]